MDEFRASRATRDQWGMVLRHRRRGAGGGRALYFGRAPLATVERPPVPPPRPGELFRDCPTCPLMMAIPAGSFDQGTAAAAGVTPFEAPRMPSTSRRRSGWARTRSRWANSRNLRTTTGLTSAGCDVYEGEWRIEATRQLGEPGIRTDFHAPRELRLMAGSQRLRCVADAEDRPGISLADGFRVGVCGTGRRGH